MPSVFHRAGHIAVWRKNYRALLNEDKGVFKVKVEEGSRSWMNVVFVGKDNETEKRFLAEGEAQGFKAMKGHRSVGGEYMQCYLSNILNARIRNTSIVVQRNHRRADSATGGFYSSIHR